MAKTDLAVEELADRLRQHFGGDPAIREQRMFGGIAFMRHGNMVVGPMKGGSLLVRTGKDGYQAALARPGAAPMEMGNRAMTGFVVVSGDVLEEDETFAGWIELAEAFVKTLPPK